MFSNTGVNKVILLGTVKGPFVKIIDKGEAFFCFSLITTEQVKKGNEQIEHQEYHKIKVPEKIMDQALPGVEEGEMLFIEGRIHTTTMIDELRVRRYNLEIFAHKIERLGTADAATEL